jgi:NAD(P)-dependent dehydrogenase (short-subunit alcohol dehydrogenase family)
MTLAGRHAFITGGGTGIAAATARALVGQGATVTVAGIDVASLQALARDNDRIHWREMDVTDEDAVAAAMSAAEEMLGPIDILVANAGIAETAPIRSTSLEFWRRMQAVNVEGVLICMRLVIDAMAARGWGRIVTISSIAGLKGYAYLGAYSASKHAVIGFTKCASEEVLGKGVTVNAICPGYADTPIVQDHIERTMARAKMTREEATRFLASTNRSGRLLDPDEIAAAILWLCGPGSDAVTGQAIAVSGGQV